MQTWHYRLETALSAREKSWKELFEHLHAINKIAKPSVYAWKAKSSKRSEMMNGDNAALVCSWLQINSKWLFENVGPSGLDSSPAISVVQPQQDELAPDERRLLSRFRSLPDSAKEKFIYSLEQEAAFQDMKRRAAEKATPARARESEQ